jgi:hypothetical protein
MTARQKLIIDLASMLDPVHRNAKGAVAAYIQNALDSPGLILAFKQIGNRYLEIAAVAERRAKELGI